MAQRPNPKNMRYTLPPGGIKAPLLEYAAKSKKVRFFHPYNWTTKINSNGVESGYVFGPEGFRTRLWFSLGNAYDPTCNTATGSIEILHSQPVTIPGQPFINVCYIEAILPDHLGQNKFVVFFGLRSKLPPFDKTQTVSGCIKPVKGGVFSSNVQSSKTLLQFESLMYTNEHSAFAFDTKKQALDYFKSPDYLQAKQIILSVTFG